MRTSILFAAWTGLVLLLPAERGMGQDAKVVPKDKLSVYFSPNAKPDPDKAPEVAIRTLNLRHNQDAGYFVHVHNGTPNETTVKVELLAGPEGKRKVVAEGVVTMPKNSTKVVPLTAKKEALPPPAPPAIGPDGKPVPAAAPVIPLDVNPVLRLTSENGADEIDKGAAIIRIEPQAYVTVSPPDVKDDGKIEIAVERVKLNEQTEAYAGGPIGVKLTPRNKNGEPIDPSRFANKDNALEAMLAPRTKGAGAPKVVLVFNKADLPAAAEGFLDLSVDGYARTKVYSFDGKAFADKEGKPLPDRFTFGVAAPVAALPATGKTIPVRLMAAEGGSGFSLVYDRTPGDESGQQILKTFDKPRNESIGIRIGENGETVFVTRSEDWSVEFPTQGIYGRKQFYAVRDGADNKPVKSSPTTVVFDSSPPKVVDLGVAPAQTPEQKEAPVAVKGRWFRPGQKIVIFAKGTDSESEIDESKGVTLYLGDKPGADGKSAPGSQVKVVKTKKNDRYEAEFTIPATTAVSELKFGAIVVNEVGLTSAQGVDEGNEATLDVDFTPPVVSILGFDPPKEPLQSFKPGETVRLFAAAIDPESKINLDDPVIFFIGDAPGPDGKRGQTNVVWEKCVGIVPGGAKTNDHVHGKEFAGKDLYAFDLTLPKEITKETEVKVGVMFKNKAGLYGSRVATIKLDKDFTTATIKVKATQGGDEPRVPGRPQPGIKVWLLDKDGNIADEAKTDDCGIAVFSKVLPGTYLVWGIKAADQNAQDFKSVTVRGGDEKQLDLSLRRQPAPPIKPPKEPKQ